MDKEKLYEMLDIDTPADFQYFEDLAELLECDEEIEEQVEDIAGIRIICQFVEDIQRVADLIAHRSDMEIKCEKDYITHMKESGYRSYHLVIYYQVETLNGPKKLQA